MPLRIILDADASTSSDFSGWTGMQITWKTIASETTTRSRTVVAWFHGLTWGAALTSSHDWAYSTFRPYDTLRSDVVLRDTASTVPLSGSLAPINSHVRFALAEEYNLHA